MFENRDNHHPTVNFAKITVLPASTLSTKHSNQGSQSREFIGNMLLIPPDSRNLNPFGLRKYQTSLNSETASLMRKTTSTILSPNEKIIEMKPWLARGSINKTEFGQELFKKPETTSVGSSGKKERIFGE